jgi:2'-5' RNA ligase
MPRGRVRNDLQKLITKLSVQYASPDFEPHVTLVGELVISENEAITKTKQLANLLKPFTISLKEVACLDEYFRCVFIKAEKTEGLMNANLTARALFKQENSEEYMPHLSLVYGDLQGKTKKAIIQHLGAETATEFAAEGLYLYYTLGQPNEWYCLLEAPLKGQKKYCKP